MFEYQNKLYRCAENEGFNSEYMLSTLKTEYEQQKEAIDCIDFLIFYGNWLIKPETKAMKLKRLSYEKEVEKYNNPKWEQREKDIQVKVFKMLSKLKIMKRFTFSLSDFNNIKNDISFWGGLIRASKKNNIIYKIPKRITFNQALAILSNLDFAYITRHAEKKGYFFDKKYNNYETFNDTFNFITSWVSCPPHLYWHILAAPEFRTARFREQFATDEIDATDFFNWSVEKGFLELAEDLNRVIPDKIAKALFEELKNHSFIPEDSVFDHRWHWIGDDTILAYLGNALSEKELISKGKGKWSNVKAYITPKSDKTPLKNSASKIKKEPNYKCNIVDNIVDLISN